MASNPIRGRLPAEQRRVLIEDAAAELFAERGYATTTLVDIAGKAGVTKPVLYRHFEGKKDLHMTLLGKYRDGLLAALAQSAAGSTPLLDRLPEILDAWLGYVEQHPYVWRMLFRDTTGDPEVQRFHRELQASARDLTATLLRRESKLDLQSEEIEPVAELIRSGTTGIALWWLDHPEVPRELLVEVVSGVLRSGLRRPSPQGDGQSSSRKSNTA